MQTKLDDPTGADVSVVMVSYNTERLLPEVMTSLRRSAGILKLQEIFVDNASRDGSVGLIRKKYPESELIENKQNVGFGRANNAAIPIISGRYVLLLNTDAFVSADTLRKTVDYMDGHPQCGALGVKLVGRDGVLQPSCRYFPTPLNIFLQRTGLQRLLPGVRLIDDMTWDHASPRICDWVPGCYLLIRRSVIDQIGLFDSRYFLYYEEVDWCYAAKKAGWQIHFLPDTTVIHIGGESALSDGEITEGGRQLESLQIESELLYFRKNHGLSTVVSDLLFQTIADLLIALKRVMKDNPKRESITRLSHAKQYWVIAFQTKFGAKPTR